MEYTIEECKELIAANEKWLIEKQQKMDKTDCDQAKEQIRQKIQYVKTDLMYYKAKLNNLIYENNKQSNL
ncbi:hypothetical protein P8825_14845 [Shouchella clausii]|uniref:hypothetical protein n=1 Tax=Shouchella clausii TaxID=79880 RepID=UPI002DBCF773|nr:hypothetical protein [Shouchella clausii]MEB5480841.1 hypothetical protein [Shouchella clausii]